MGITTAYTAYLDSRWAEDKIFEDWKTRFLLSIEKSTQRGEFQTWGYCKKTYKVKIDEFIQILKHRGFKASRSWISDTDDEYRVKVSWGDK